MDILRIATWLSWLLIGLGTVRTLLGYALVYSAPAPAERQFLSTTNTDDLINKGLTILAAGIILAVLIALAKRKFSN